jgi:hypothetical protein
MSSSGPRSRRQASAQGLEVQVSSRGGARPPCQRGTPRDPGRPREHGRRGKPSIRASVKPGTSSPSRGSGTAAARFSSRSRGSLRYVTGRWRHARVRVRARERPLESRECLEEPDRLECPVAAAYCHLPHHASGAQPFDRIAGRLESASDVSRSSRYREHRQRRKRGDESVCRRVCPYPSEPRP